MAFHFHIYLTTHSKVTLCPINYILPVSAFKLCIQKGVLKIKGDTLSRWSFFRDFRQAKHNPGVNFSKTELAF